MPENDVPRLVPCGNSRCSAHVPEFLPPAILWLGQAVVACKAIQFAILRPRWTGCSPRETLQTFLQLDCFSHAPYLHPAPRIVLRLLPMRGHHRTEEVQLECEVRVPGSNHLVIYEFFGRSKVATQATLAAPDEISRVVHPQLHGLLMGPVLRRVGAKPSRSRTVATFATDPVNQLKALSPLLRWN